MPYWQPPSLSSRKPEKRLQAEHGLAGLERPQPHILSSPPGTQAPTHLINYTPDTNEVHGPGSIAPVDKLNYSLMPHDADLGSAPKVPTGMGMGAGIDWGNTQGPGIASPGSPPGATGNGRYAPAQSARDNSFSPGQPPISAHPYGTGPGPQLQATGPEVRNFDQRGSMMGNASSFGAGQEAPDPLKRPDFSGLTDEVPDASAGATAPVQAAPAPAAAAAAAPPPAAAAPSKYYPEPGEAEIAAQNNIAALPGYHVEFRKDANGRYASAWQVPDDPNDKSKPPVPMGYFLPGNPDPIKGTTDFVPYPADVRKQMMGANVGPDTHITTEIRGEDGLMHRFLIDKKDPNSKIDLGISQKAATPKTVTPGISGNHQTLFPGKTYTMVYTLNADGTKYEFDAEATKTAQAAAKAEEAQTRQDKTDAAQLQSATSLATATPWDVKTDASGQAWLINMNTGAKDKLGPADLEKGYKVVGNAVIKVPTQPGEKPETVYEPPHDMKVDTINGKTVVYDPRDPKKTLQTIDENEFYLPTQQATLSKLQSDAEKAKQDLLKAPLDRQKLEEDIKTGKVTRAEAMARVQKQAYDIMNPQPIMTSTDIYMPPGMQVDIDYGGSRGVKHYDTGKNEYAQSAYDQIQQVLKELKEGGTPAAPAAAATTGAAAPAAATTQKDQAKPAEAAAPAQTTGTETTAAPAETKPGWQRADQEQGRTPAGNAQAQQAGLTGTVSMDDPRWGGIKATPEQIAAAKKAASPLGIDTDNPLGLEIPVEINPDEEEIGAGNAGDFWDLKEDPTQSKNLIDEKQGLAKQMEGGEDQPRMLQSGQENLGDPLGLGFSLDQMGVGNQGWDPRMGAGAEFDPLNPETWDEVPPSRPFDPNQYLTPAPDLNVPNEPLDEGDFPPLTPEERKQMWEDLGGNPLDEQRHKDDVQRRYEEAMRGLEGNPQQNTDEDEQRYQEELARQQREHPGADDDWSPGHDTLGPKDPHVRDEPYNPHDPTQPPLGEDQKYPQLPWDVPPTDPDWRKMGPQDIEGDQRNNAGLADQGIGGGLHMPEVKLPDIKAPDWLDEFLKKGGRGHQPSPPVQTPGHKPSPPLNLPQMPGPKLPGMLPGGPGLSFFGAGQEAEPPPPGGGGGLPPGVPPDIETLRGQVGGAPGGGAPPASAGALPSPGALAGSPPNAGAPSGPGMPGPGTPGWTPPVPPGDVAGIGHRFGQEMNQGEPVHSGVDLQAPEGTDTIAPVDGMVESVENDPQGLGLVVMIRGNDGTLHKLGHLKSTNLYRGMQVAKGQNLATQVGSTGNSTGSHLHWAVRDQQGQPVDPTAALGPMASLPPVPGTEMMGPPGGSSSPPGGSPPAPGGAPPQPPTGGAPPPMGGGQDSMDSRWDRYEAKESQGFWGPRGQAPITASVGAGQDDDEKTFDRPIRDAASAAGDWAGEKAQGALDTYGTATGLGRNTFAPNVERPSPVQQIWGPEMVSPEWRAANIPNPAWGATQDFEQKVNAFPLFGGPGDARIQRGMDIADVRNKVLLGDAAEAGIGKEWWHNLPMASTGARDVPGMLEHLKTAAPAALMKTFSTVGPDMIPQAVIDKSIDHFLAESGAPDWREGSRGRVTGYGLGNDRMGAGNRGELTPEEKQQAFQQGYENEQEPSAINWIQDLRKQYDNLVQRELDEHRKLIERGGPVASTPVGQGMLDGGHKPGAAPQTGTGHQPGGLPSLGGGHQPGINLPMGPGINVMPKGPGFWNPMGMGGEGGMGAGLGQGDPMPPGAWEGGDIYLPPQPRFRPPAPTSVNSGWSDIPGQEQATFNPAQPDYDYPAALSEQHGTSQMAYGAGGERGMGAGAAAVAMTPSQQAQIDALNRQIDEKIRNDKAIEEQNRVNEDNRHGEALAKIDQDWRIHQDNDRRQQEINAETSRHNQEAEKIERERIQADKDIEQMKEASQLKMQEMTEGNKVYLQEGSQAFTDWQTRQKAKMDILSSALNNPWLQKLQGMTPGPGYQGQAVGGKNISNLINDILSPYDVSQYGVENAPNYSGFGSAGYNPGGGANAQYYGAQGGAQGAPGTPGGQALPQQGSTTESGGTGQPITAQQWRSWDPFQKAAYRTDVEALGPGAWQQQQEALAGDFLQQGMDPNVTRMQATAGGATGRAGAEMTADVFGQAPQNFWDEQQRQWSRAQAPQVKQQYSGIAA
jgi:hypothetical protein